MNIFSLYCTRSASASMTKRLHLLIDVILKKGGWKRKTSHGRQFDKPIKELYFAAKIKSKK